MSRIWINGVLIDKAVAGFSPFDHGLLYGDGVWEPFRLVNGTPFAAEQHLRILSDTAQIIGIHIPLSPHELLAAIEATAQANGRAEGYGRILVTRGPGTVGPDPRKLHPQVLVMVEEYRPFPEELYGHGLHVVVSPLQLDPHNPAHRLRTLNQLHVVEAKRHALRHGCLESLFESLAGELVGATEGILFAVKGKDIVIAGQQRLDATGSAVAALCNHAGFVATQHTLTRADLLAADEAFLAGTACGVIGLVRVNGTAIGNGSEGPVTCRVRAEFDRLTRKVSG